jgi:hypothetical protein
VGALAIVVVGALCAVPSVVRAQSLPEALEYYATDALAFDTPIPL